MADNPPASPGPACHRHADDQLRSDDQRLQQQNATLLSLVSKGTLFQADLHKAIAGITEACSTLIGTERVSVWTYNEDGSTIRCIDLYQHSKHLHTSGEILRSEDFPTYTASHKKGDVIAAVDVFTDPRTTELPADYLRAHDIRSLLDAPVWLHDRLGALLSFEHIGEQRQWTREDERLAADMATLVTLCFEVNERKRTEDALLTSEQSYRGLFDASGDAFIVHDADTGLIIDINQTMIEMFGFTSEEVLGHNISAFSEKSPAYAEEQSKRRIQAALVEGPQVFDWRFQHKDGHLFWAEVSLRRCTIQNHLRVLASVRDITERKRTEDALRLNESRLEALMELDQMREVSLNEMAQYIMDQAVRLTQSSLGYVAFVNEEQTKLTMHAWSQAAMQQCKIVDRPLVFPLETTGL